MMNLNWIPLIVPLGLFLQSHREIPAESFPFGEFLCNGTKRALDRFPASMRALVPDKFYSNRLLSFLTKRREP